MRPEVMSPDYVAAREELTRLFSRVHALTIDVGREDLAEVADGLLGGVNAPFLFVVVGEVKSGKSSFVNALLGQHVCAVAPDPCTDRIHKLVWSATPGERQINDQVVEIGRPVDILREIVIVDTPGTNSIIARHQEITERFIPEADLVVFVFPAINPYSQTAWDLFRLVHDTWLKKIVFVLQQADRATPEELAINTARVAEYAGARGLVQPRIFQTSAKGFWDAPEASGVPEIWDYIRSTITGGRQYRLKMESLLATAERVLRSLGEELEAQSDLLQRDTQEAATIREALVKARTSAGKEIEQLTGRLLAAYDTQSMVAVGEFEDGLSLGNLVRASLGGVFKRGNPLRDWAEGVSQRFGERLGANLDDLATQGASLLADHLTLVLERLRAELRSDTVPRPLGDSLPAMTRERFTVLDQVVRNLDRFLAGDELARSMRPKNLKAMGDQTLIGGFVAAVGAVIAASAHVVVIDVTGGIVSALGALLALGTLFVQRRRVIRRFREGFATGRERFARDLEQKLTAELEHVFGQLGEAFAPYFRSLDERGASLAALGQRVDELKGRLAALRDQVDQLPMASGSEL